MQDPFITMVDLLNSKIQGLQTRLNEMEDVHFTLSGEIRKLENEKRVLSESNSDLANSIAYWRDRCMELETANHSPTQEKVAAELYVFLCSDAYKNYVKTGEKIRCIKAVRTLTKWGLKESKDWTEQAWKEYPEGRTPDPCLLCGEDRNHPSQYGKHGC